MRNIRKKFIGLMLVAIFLAACVTFLPSRVSSQDGRRVVNPDVVDALGELLRDMKTLNGSRKELPKEDEYSETIRGKYEIPSRVPVVAPRGGNEIVALVFSSENLCMVQGEYAELGPNEYKYLQSLHNLKTVYTLFDREPLTLGQTVYAFERSGAGDVVVFFNNKGRLRSVSVKQGNSICLKDSPYIVRPLASLK